jgi:SAM-dependent methyltransferase
MHIEFIDLLRCTRDHEETWLVAALHQMDGRLVIEAKLGCPACGAEFFISDGVANFSSEANGGAAIRAAAEEDAAMRIAAFLDLTSPGRVVLLAGELTAASEMLSELADARIFSLNPPSREHALRAERVAEIRAHSRIPLAAKSLDGIALDAQHSTQEMLAEAARLLRPRGRLLAGPSARLSPQFRELARDADHLIAEYVGELVTLRR